MTVFKVKAGDKISAESFNRITDAVNPGVGAMDAAAAEKRIKASWKNCGETEVPAGSVVTCRLRDASDPEKAKKRFLNDGFCLEGPVETDRKVYPTATLLKTARPGKIVPCMIEGLVAGLVKCNGEEEPTTAGACEIDANGCNFQAGKNGFAVLACTELGTIKGGSYRFCLMRGAAEKRGICYVANPYKTPIKPGVVEVWDFYHRFDSVEEARRHYQEHGLVLEATDRRKSKEERREIDGTDFNGWPSRVYLPVTVLEEIAPRDDVDDKDGPEGFSYGEAIAEGFSACEFNAAALEESRRDNHNVTYAVRSPAGLDFRCDYFSGEFRLLNYVKDSKKSDTLKAVPKYYVTEPDLDNTSIITYKSHKVPDNPTVSFKDKYNVAPEYGAVSSYDKSINYSDVSDIPEPWDEDFDEEGYGLVSSQEKLCFGTIWKYPKPQAMIATCSVPTSPCVRTVSITDPNDLSEQYAQVLFPFSPKKAGRGYVIIAPMSARLRTEYNYLCGAVVIAVVDKGVRDYVFVAENRMTGSRPLEWDDGNNNYVMDKLNELEKRIKELEGGGGD